MDTKKSPLGFQSCLEHRSINRRGNPPLVAPQGVRGRHGGTATRKNQEFWDYWTSALDVLETIARASIAAVLTIATLDLPAQADFLEKWRFDATGNQLEITLKEGTTPRYFLLAEPLRIVLDLPNTTLGNVETQHSYPGAVRQIRVAQFQPDVTRIVLELSPDVILQPEQVQLRAVASSGNRWVLRPLIASSQIRAEGASATTLPPATFSDTRTPVVKVPPLNRPQPSTPNPPAPVTNIPATTLSTTDSENNQQTSITVPVSASPASQTPAPRAIPEIAFGEPLPSSPRQEGQTKPNYVAPPPQNSAGASPRGQAVEQDRMPQSQKPLQTLPREAAEAISATSVAPTVTVPPLKPSTAAVPAENSPSVASDVLLAAGTVLTLRYPGEKAITLQSGFPLQEVLLLTEAIRDRAGNIIAPVGTPVIGHFETNSQGSRFIAQAIILGGRNIPISAQSVPLPHNRQGTSNRIEPNQILPVQLKEDLR